MNEILLVSMNVFFRANECNLNVIEWSTFSINECNPGVQMNVFSVKMNVCKMSLNGVLLVSMNVALECK